MEGENAKISQAARGESDVSVPNETWLAESKKPKADRMRPSIACRCAWFFGALGFSAVDFPRLRRIQKALPGLAHTGNPKLAVWVPVIALARGGPPPIRQRRRFGRNAQKTLSNRTVSEAGKRPGNSRICNHHRPYCGRDDYRDCCNRRLGADDVPDCARLPWSVI